MSHSDPEWIEQVRADLKLTDIDAENMALRSELAEARRDAQRYRWLRGGDTPYTDEIRDVMALQLNAKMDAAIDAAIAGKKK